MKITKQYLKNLIKESLLTEQISQEIQKLIDQNQFLKGKLVAKEEDLVQGSKYVLVLPEESTKHIKERHMDGSKPGSLFNPNIDLKKAALSLLNKQPSEASGGRVKWLGVDSGMQIGSMGVAKADQQTVQAMKDYQMPDGKKETVKISAGKRKPTAELSLITAELGDLADGKKALSLITMFPGGMEVDGVQIPNDRAEFAAKGLYFPVDSNSPLLQSAQSSVAESTKQYLKKIIKEELNKVLREKAGNEKLNSLDYSFGYNEMGGDEVQYYITLNGTYNNAFDKEPIDYSVTVNLGRDVNNLQTVIAEAADQIATGDPAEILMKDDCIEMINTFLQADKKLAQKLAGEIEQKVNAA